MAFSAVVDRDITSPFLAFTFLFFLATPVVAQDYNKGVEAYERGNFPVALQEWLPLAKRGKASAQFNLCQMYFLGRGVSQNYAEALNWCTLAADQGNAKAQNTIGRMYDTGRGLEQNFTRAYMWYALAVEQANRLQPNMNVGRFARDARAARDSVARRMTPEQIAEAQDFAREWMANQGLSTED